MTLAAVTQRTRPLVAIEHLALQALKDELKCYPKPGLVSYVDSGSHRDMDASTFLNSINALRGYFQAMAAAGSQDAGFGELNALGRAAEQRMLAATGGCNTHRGAIFTLGLLAAAAGTCMAEGIYRADVICRTAGRKWGAAVLAMEQGPIAVSHGLTVRRRFGVTGAREQAASGFPAVLSGLSEYRRTRALGGTPNDCAVHVLFAAIASLPDNNLLYRGGLEGLAFAQNEAKAFLELGGMLVPCGRAKAIAVHRRFMAAKLSPGGAADLLAATTFLDALEQWGWRSWGSH